MDSLLGSISSVPEHEFAELLTLSSETLRESLEITRKEIADFEVRLGSPCHPWRRSVGLQVWPTSSLPVLTSPPAPGTEREREDLEIQGILVMWDEARQWLSAFEVALPWVEKREKLQAEVDAQIALQEELEQQMETPGLSHSDQAGFDAGWDETDAAICYYQGLLEKHVREHPFPSSPPQVRSPLDRGSRFEAEVEEPTGGASGGSGLSLCPDCDGMFSCRCLQERLEMREAEHAREVRAHRRVLEAAGCTCTSDSEDDYGGYQCDYCRDQEDRRCKACGSLPTEDCNPKCCGGCESCEYCCGPACRRCKEFGSDCCCYQDSEPESEEELQSYGSSRRYRRNSGYSTLGY